MSLESRHNVEPTIRNASQGKNLGKLWSTNESNIYDHMIWRVVKSDDDASKGGSDVDIHHLLPTQKVAWVRFVLLD